MKKIALVILCFVLVITGCFIAKMQVSNSQKQSSDPAKQVVENYFKYLNEKDKKEFLDKTGLFFYNLF
ncbi:ABC-type uncharacterized transport system fused permease/ATPase subunit [Clostridium algifaecis]|uniref:ABC-type uncharacterized transport system fused permease/ATPase subunit n=1 Tax=Clostridium algifaecis TaxID=1472040 RepID=A0ABS4KVQ2_9CLOT|nr:hypothetical protein [Clostridium algifaecis]MBP2034128.1 ABC-type uncharacterized transport system fused permease/ATPase subunit [Clostridium algifaecis]